MAISVLCQLTVEIPGSNFGEDWNIKEIIRVTKEEAPNRLLNMMKNQGTQIRIIGNPIVTTIISTS